eukprot:12905811-Alexandrium_andersonii.AAC.1
MSIGDPPTSSERSVRPRARSITIGRITADGFETELQAIEDCEVKEDVGVRRWTPRQKQDITPMRLGHVQKTP